MSNEKRRTPLLREIIDEYLHVPPHRKREAVKSTVRHLEAELELLRRTNPTGWGEMPDRLKGEALRKRGYRL